jgi:hypothetical protein
MEWIIAILIAGLIVGGIWGVYEEARKIQKNTERIIELMTILNSKDEKDLGKKEV